MSARRVSGFNAAGIVFDNNAGGTFGLGRTVNLGTGSDGVAAGRLQNEGVMSALTVGSIGQSTLTGDLTQSSGGTLHVDFDFSGDNDLLTVEGGKAVDLAGTVAPKYNADLPSSGDSGSFAILVSRPGITTNSLQTSSTATVDYTLSQEAASGGGQQVSLHYDVHYSPWIGSPQAQTRVASSGVTPTANHTSFGAHVDDLVGLRQRALAASASVRTFGGALSPSADDYAFVDDLVRQLVEMEDVAALIETYDRYASGTIMMNADATLHAALRFNDALAACPTVAVVGTTVLTDDRACAWARLSGIANRRDRDGLMSGYDENVFSLSAGVEVGFADNWSAGAAIGYETFDLSNVQYDDDGYRLMAGAMLAYAFGDTTISGALSGGLSDSDYRREVFTPGGLAYARGDPDLTFISAHARVAHEFAFGEAFVKPWIDVGLEQQWQGGYTEKGAGPFGLVVDDVSHTFFTINPMLEAGTRFALWGANFEATARAGMLAILGDNNRDAVVRLAGVAVGGPGFEISDDRNEVFAQLGAALEAKVGERVTVGADFDTLLSGDQQIYSGGLRLSVEF